MKIKAIYVGVVGLACLQLPVAAGQLFVLNVSYSTILRRSDVTVLVNSTNQYLGAVDANDNNWFVQTLLNHTDGTGSLSDWLSPEFFGAGRNGSAVFGGMTVLCGNGCGANGEIWRPIWGSGVPLYYVGRGGAVIYHQFFPEIDTVDGATGSVPFTFEGAGCGPASAGTAVHLLQVAGAEFSIASPASVWTNPQDDVEGEPYLIEDWALIELGTETKVLDASYSGFARHMQSSFNNLAVGDAASEPSQVLVIDYPVHPHNARHVEPPKLILRNKVPATAYRGRAVVRVDFAPEGHVRGIDLLNELGTEGALLLPHLRRQLGLEKVSDRGHRAIAFVVLDIGKELVIADSFIYMPTCCCPEWPYCPV